MPQSRDTYTIDLEMVKKAIAFIYFHTDPDYSVIDEWMNAVDALLPSHVRRDQIEYAVAVSAKKSRKPSDLDSKVIALVLLFQHYAQQSGESKTLKDTQNGFKDLNGDIEESAHNLVNDFQDIIAQKESREPVPLRPNLTPVLIDQLLRWTALGIFASYNLPFASNLFLLIQGLIIPLLTLTYSFFRSKKAKEINTRLLSTLDLHDKIDLRLQGSPFYFFTLLIIASYSSLIGYLSIGLETNDTTGLSFSLLLLLWGFYLSIFYTFSHSSINERYLKNHMNNRFGFGDKLSGDTNDEIIIELKERLRATTSRLDAYILESVLFGTLAFSGFLQIMAENLVTFEDLDIFADNTLAAIIGIVNFDSDSINFSYLKERPALFSLISIETLVCSILFIGVIGSRLRFSNIADRINLSLETASTLNTKEETLIYQQKVQKDNPHLLRLNEKITVELQKAQLSMTEIGPITGFMRFFRNSGILVFIIILISSALLIDRSLAVVFLVFSIATYAYLRRSELFGSVKSIRFRIQYFVINYSYVIIISSISLFALATVTSIYYQWSFYNLLIVAAFTLFLVYRILYIFLVPFHDDRFSEKPHPLLKIIWAAGEFLLMIGAILFFSSLPGTAVFFGIGMLVYVAAMVSLGLKFSKNRWIGLIYGIGTGLAIIAGVFKVLAISISEVAFYFSLGLLGILSLLVLIRKISIHRQLVFLMIGILAVSIYFVNYHRTHRWMIVMQTSDLEQVGIIRDGLQVLYSNQLLESEKDKQKVLQALNLLSSQYQNSYVADHFSGNLLRNLEYHTSDPKSEEIATKEIKVFLAKLDRLKVDAGTDERYLNLKKHFN